MKKIALFAFNGDPMCFIHVLLNALDMHANGVETKIVLEGTATQLITELDKTGHPLHPLWEKARPTGSYRWCVQGLFQQSGNPCRSKRSESQPAG